MMKNRLLLFVVFLTISFYNDVYGIGTPPPPPGGGGGPPCWPPGTCIPIDGGIVFLATAGVIYGFKKIYDYKNN